MGATEIPSGDNGNGGLVRLFGYQEQLSLDGRGRFRLPDHLVSVLRQELVRVRHSNGALNQAPVPERLSLYFVPGTRQQVFLYPPPNVRLAIRSFEDPPPGIDPHVIRGARDYFYLRMRFVEADKQNRLMIPDGLRQHAHIDDTVEQVTLVAHNNWLSLTRSELVEQRTMENLEAFEQAAPDLLNPAYPRPSGPSDDSASEEL